MKIYNIKDMHNGWFIGNFTPSILKSKEFEVGHHLYKKNYKDKYSGHFHKLSTEYNYIISGKVIVDGNTLSTGDIFVYEPYDRSNVKFVEDTNLIIVKTPSIPDDKYLN